MSNNRISLFGFDWNGNEKGKFVKVQSFDSWTAGFKCNNVHKIYFFGQINGKPFFDQRKRTK